MKSGQKNIVNSANDKNPFNAYRHLYDNELNITYVIS